MLNRLELVIAALAEDPARQARGAECAFTLLAVVFCFPFLADCRVSDK
jgi:hypothetical protein